MASELLAECRICAGLGYYVDSAGRHDCPRCTRRAVAADPQGLRDCLAVLFIDFAHAESQWQFMNEERNWPRPDPMEFASRAIAALTAPSPELAATALEIARIAKIMGRMGSASGGNIDLLAAEGQTDNIAAATAPEAVRGAEQNDHTGLGGVWMPGFGSCQCDICRKERKTVRIENCTFEPAPAPLSVAEAATKIADSLVPGGAKWATDYDMRRLEQIIGRVAGREVEECEVCGEVKAWIRGITGRPRCCLVCPTCLSEQLDQIREVSKPRRALAASGKEDE